MTRADILPVAPASAAKFFLDGRPRSYPGNTMSAAFIADPRPDRALRSVVAALQRGGDWSGAFCFLPPATWHMTVLRGVNDCMRAPGNWPRGISLDTTLDIATQYMRQRLERIFPPRNIITTSQALKMNEDGDIRLVLETVGRNQTRRLEQYRDALKRTLGHQRRDSGGAIHLTLAYRSRSITRQDAWSIHARLRDVWRDCRTDLVTVRFGKPALIRYETMLDFHHR